MGSAIGIPCPGGTYGGSEGLTHADNCTKVSRGFWAPLGSPEPESCSSGFYCPGYEDDEENTVPGSKPLIMPTGGSVEVQDVEVVKQEISLDMTCADFDYDSIVQTLANQYNVDVSLVSFANPCESASTLRRGRKLARLSITIEIATPAADPSGAAPTTTAADILSAMSSVSASDLATSIGAALGTTVNISTTAPQQTVEQRTVRLECPAGKWCTAGLIVDCGENSYNNETGKTTAVACKLCPLNSYTANTSSTSIDDCLCLAGFYDSIAGHGVDCKVCPVGTECGGGATIDRLPLSTGYFRLDNTTIDVRRCPDADSNCSTNFGMSECVSTSGCVGGTDVKTMCADTLDGTFCQTCDRSSGELVYYVKATGGAGGEVATCKPCGDTLSKTLVTGVAVLAGVLVALVLLTLLHRHVPAGVKEKYSLTVGKSGVGTKIKIVLGFYMIATKVDTIYSVALPADVRGLIESLTFVVSLGLGGVATTPLECLGLDGYVPRLLFWMIFPVAVSAVVLVGVCVQRCLAQNKKRGAVLVLAERNNDKSKSTHMHAYSLDNDESKDTRERGSTMMESVLPPLLRIMFLLYPLVTNVAFEGFPCFEFEGGRAFLMTDVKIECGTDDHSFATLLSWIAVSSANRSI